MTYHIGHVHSYDVYLYMVTNIWVTIQACSTDGVPHVRMLLYDRVTICCGVLRGGVWGVQTPPRNSEVLTKLHLIAN